MYDLHTGRVYNHAGYDVTDYFRLAVIEVKKTDENAASDGFGWHFERTFYVITNKFYTLIGDNWLHKSNQYDVTSWFQSAAKCN